MSKWLLFMPLMLAAVVFISAAGYWLIEDQPFLMGLYYTLVTISTVGSREAPNMSAAGLWWTAAVIVVGVGLTAATFSMAVAALTEGTLRRVIGRRHVEHAIKRLEGHTIVCGFGRVGAMVTGHLREAGRDVVAVESSAERMAEPDAEGVLFVQGDAQDEAVLTAAGVDRAANLVACLQSDADNVFVTLTARQLNRTLTIVARAVQPATQNKLLHAGADRVICPQTIGATRIAQGILRPAVVDFVEVANQGVDLEMDQLVVADRSDLVGKTLLELALPSRIGAMVVAVRRADGKTVYNPGASLKLSAGDTLILVGPSSVAAAVQKLQSKPPTDQPVDPTT